MNSRSPASRSPKPSAISSARASPAAESTRKRGSLPPARARTPGSRRHPTARCSRATSSPSIPTSSAPWASTTTSRGAGSSAIARPTRTQATLLDLARDQIAHNIDLLRPGVSVVEYASRAFRLPDAYLANRYADLAHGCGLGVEYPFVLYPEDADDGMYDGRFEADVIVCVESYVGAQGGPEGVKLEEPVLITENGPEVLTALPLDADDF